MFGGLRNYCGNSSVSQLQLSGMAQHSKPSRWGLLVDGCVCAYCHLASILFELSYLYSTKPLYLCVFILWNARYQC